MPLKFHFDWLNEHSYTQTTPIIYLAQQNPLVSLWLVIAIANESLIWHEIKTSSEFWKAFFKIALRYISESDLILEQT